MQAEKTYIKLIDLSQLFNWSVQGLLDTQFSYSKNYELAKIGDFLIKSRKVVNIKDEQTYNRVTVRINNNGVVRRDTEKGVNIGTKKQYLASAGQFIVSKIDARNGAFGIIPPDLDGAIVTNDFPLFNVDKKRVLPQFLLLITTTKLFIKFAQSCSSGTTNRQRMDIDLFLEQQIPLPQISQQKEIIDRYTETIAQSKLLNNQAKEKEVKKNDFIYHVLDITNSKSITKSKFTCVDFTSLYRWDIGFLLGKTHKLLSKYPLVKYGDLFLSIRNGIAARNYSQNGLRFLKVADIKNNTISDVDVKYINRYKEKEIINEKTLLITRKGTVGQSFYLNSGKYTASSEIFIIELNLSKVDGDYLAEINLTEFVQTQYREKYTGTIMPSMSQEKLLEIQVPLPDKQTQRNIVKQISNFRAEISDLLYKANQKAVEAISNFEKSIYA